MEGSGSETTRPACSDEGCEGCCEAAELSKAVMFLILKTETVSK